MVGEYFEEPAVVGCALSIRAKNNILSVWTRRNDTYLCFKLGYSPLSLQALLMAVPLSVVDVSLDVLTCFAQSQSVRASLAASHRLGPLLFVV